MTPGTHICAHYLTAVLALAGGAVFAAEALPFEGRWVLDGSRDANVPYTALHIERGSLTWRGAGKSAPSCSRTYALKPEARGTEYANARGTRFVAGFPGSLPTYLLSLGAGDCGSAADTVRIIYPLVYDTRHIEVIEYAKGKAVGVHRFQRRK